nr:hypothetical protein [Tanacetum cinerariifolium]
MARLAFCDYHNMVAILEKYKHNVDFHQIVDFVEASPIRYALTINPTVYVSHIRHFWSTARIEKTNEGTKILATVDGKPRTISKLSIRRNLKPKDEAGISSLSDAELFENLTLMGYNILPNQKGSIFPSVKVSNPYHYAMFKSKEYRLAFCDYHNMVAILEKYEHNVDFYQIVDFVEASPIRYALTINPTVYVSHIRQFWSTARIEKRNEGTKILATVDGKPKTISKSSIRRNLKPKDEAGISSLPDAKLFENLTLMGYNILPNQKGLIFPSVEVSNPYHYAMFKSKEYRVNSPSFSGWTVPLFESMLVLMSEGSGTPTEPQYTLSPEAQQSPPIATLSPSLPHPTALLTVTDEPASPFGDGSQGEACPTVSGLEAEQDRANIGKTSTLPHDSPPRVTSLAADEGSLQHQLNELLDLIKMLEDKDGGVAKQSGEDATIKGKSLETGEEAVVEKSTVRGSNDTEELVNVLTSLDVASILTCRIQMVSVPLAAEVATEYEQFVADLSIEERIEMFNDLVKYQDNYVKVLKYESQQRKPLSKKQQREFYMSVLKSHSRWKTKHFKGMSLDEIREKFIPVWKQIEDFVPIGSKEEGERFKKKGLRLEQDSAKKVKTSEEVSEEDLKTMMQLVPVEEIIRLGGNTAVYQFFVDMLNHFDREDLNQLWTLVKETLSIRHATSNKEKELWVELKRLYKPDVEDQLWTQTQALMHDPVEWRLYDSCGVHHVLSRD